LITVKRATDPILSTELDDCIVKALKEDPHLSTRNSATALNIRLRTVRNDLTKSSGMKYCHMGWVPRTLTAAQKVKSVDVAGSMLQRLESQTASNFHFLWIGDELWMFYEYHHEIMEAASWENVDELEQPTHYHGKTMITAFSNGTGKVFPNILHRSRSRDTKYYAERLFVG
jgi:hypothetical protein